MLADSPSFFLIRENVPLIPYLPTTERTAWNNLGVSGLGGMICWNPFPSGFTDFPPSLERSFLQVN